MQTTTKQSTITNFIWIVVLFLCFFNFIHSYLYTKVLACSSHININRHHACHGKQNLQIQLSSYSQLFVCFLSLIYIRYVFQRFRKRPYMIQKIAGFLILIEEKYQGQKGVPCHLPLVCLNFKISLSRHSDNNAGIISRYTYHRSRYRKLIR